LAGVAVVAAAGALAAAGGGAYGHAYALLWAKLRWLGVRPVDPALLAPDARMFWMGPYDTTTLRRAFIEYGPLLPFAAAAFAWAVVRRAQRRTPPSPVSSFIPLVMTAATGVLYWLIVRLTIFAAPWLVAWAAAPLALARRRAAKVAAAVVLTGLFGYQIYWLSALERPTPVRRLVELLPASREPLWDYGAGDNDVFLWLGEHTKPGAAVLAQFGVSASILYWSHRPVALHPMFEVPEIRPKILAASGAYCGSEAALYELCRRWRISYVVFNAPAFLIYEPPGERYFAAAPAPPADAAGMKMQFRPETLRYFRLVRETYAFRVFEVGRRYDGYRARRYHPYFDPAVFGRLPSADEYYGEVAKIRRALDHYRLGLGYERGEKWTAAAAAYGRALGLHPDLEEAEQRLGYCLVRSGRLAEAGPHFRRAVATDPENALAHTYMGSFYLETGRYPAAVAEYRRAAALAPGDRDARARLAWVEKINAGP
jgi:hypothetical protein